MVPVLRPLRQEAARNRELRLSDVDLHGLRPKDPWRYQSYQADCAHRIIIASRRRSVTLREWIKQHDTCWICGSTNNLETHHIVGGPMRKAATKKPCTWFRACHQCHQLDGGLHDAAAWPLAKQLAIKMCHDETLYDRGEVLTLKGYTNTAVTAWEVCSAYIQWRFEGL